ncbi:hypothetical protein [Deinococcus aluminii]|uniref:VanZ family protein n=1 Tax=Deinococcus aluminii TaxID=1656885 RepID=A0ABP9XIR6_9DEIO
MYPLVRCAVFGVWAAILLGLILLGLSVWQWHAGPADVAQMLDRSLGGVAGLWVGALMRDWARSRKRPG